MKNFSIRSRLVASLMILIVTFTGFGLFAILKIRELEGVTRSIYDDPLKVSTAAIEARVEILRMQRMMKDMLLAKDEHMIAEGVLGLQDLEQTVYQNLDNIKMHAESNMIKNIESEIRQSFASFRHNHTMMIEELFRGNRGAALDTSIEINNTLVDFMDGQLKDIDDSAKARATELVQAAGRIQANMERLLISLNIALGVLLSAIFVLVIRSIVSSITKLQETMDESTETGVLQEAVLEGKNEITGIASYYNLLIQKLRNQFWIKDGQNALNHEISKVVGLRELSQRSLNLLIERLNAGKGAVYIYNEHTGKLELHATYAYTEKERKYESYALGEGIVGQAGLDHKLISIENLINHQDYISTGLNIQAPINIYSLPLVFEDKLYGVVELASFEAFNELKHEFLHEAGLIIASNIYSEIQNQKVKDLLEISERAKTEASHNAAQLLAANQVLEEQQSRLQQQSEELQQTNAELEEQQQMLQQQSEELQQTNMQLEEQQILMEEQSKLLNMRNQQLEASGQELINRAKELEKANKYKSEFLANMSHELRTPLNSIILLSNLLMKSEKNRLQDRDLQKLDVIYSSGQELLRLINDILDLSKIEAGRMNVMETEFGTEAMVTDIKKMFESMAEEKGIDFICKDSAGAKLYGDYNKIVQIIRNLVSNAIKFTSRGYVRFEIKPGQPEDILMEVSDTGIGIPEDDLKKIFDEFIQGDGTISRRYGGTGLGLSISRKLAELMNAEILVESEAGVGSIFTLRLRNARISRLKSDGLPVDLAIEEAAITDNSYRTILVVEDDADFAEYIRTINENMGFGTIIAGTGREALRIVRSHTIDAILLDLILPDISGMEVLQELKSTQELRTIPVHIISAKDKSKQPLKTGAVGYKQKAAGEAEIAGILAAMSGLKEQKPKSVLIAEDDEAHLDAVRSLIKQANIRVETVNTLEGLKQRLQVDSFDAIILNLELESGKGIDACKHLHIQKCETPVIAYTGKEITVDQEKEIRKYADSIIIKTANSDERLLDEVTLFLHRVRTSDRKGHYLISKTNRQNALDLSNKKVLIVDDDARNIYVLASALEDFGAEILEAGNGKEALEILEQDKVDLILMDIMMPIMDGYQAIKAIRSKEELKRIPIIAVTAKSLKDDRSKCIAAGANDYISKPIEYDTLTRLIKAWINK